MGPKKVLLIGGGLWSLFAFQGYLIKRLAAKEGVDITDDAAVNQWIKQRSKGGFKLFQDSWFLRAAP